MQENVDRRADQDQSQKLERVCLAQNGEKEVHEQDEQEESRVFRYSTESILQLDELGFFVFVVFRRLNNVWS